LHSLAGGDAGKRRDCLQKLISDPRLPLFQRGVVIHAFGDAYAHSFRDTSGNEALYEYPVGHGSVGTLTDLANGTMGLGPDMPSRRPKLFAEYVNALFNALPPGSMPSNSNRLKEIVESLKDLPSHPIIADKILAAKLAAKFDYPRAYRPELGMHTTNVPEAADDLGSLTKGMIDQVIALINTACCR